MLPYTDYIRLLTICPFNPLSGTSDAFDIPSFFALHDLNRDGIWDKEEIEAIYGVHHPYSKDKTPDKQQHDAKATRIVEEVLKAIDRNEDGFITLAEFEVAGLEGLPDFSSWGAEGHHYDVESGQLFLKSLTIQTTDYERFCRILLAPRRGLSQHT